MSITNFFLDPEVLLILVFELGVFLQMMHMTLRRSYVVSFLAAVDLTKIEMYFAESSDAVTYSKLASSSNVRY